MIMRLNVPPEFAPQICLFHLKLTQVIKNTHFIWRYLIVSNELFAFSRLYKLVQRLMGSFPFILSFNFIRSSGINSDAKGRSNQDFDILIFTQRWPITDCMTWMNRGGDNVCLLPSQRDAWLIHGVWPTKYGTIGPGFCNRSAPFDLDSLEPLIDQMRQYWLNIEKGE